jgi:hypothetical protein
MRMLMSMKANIEAARALTYEAALSLDLARAGDAKMQAKVDLLTPVVKAWCTDMAVDVASIGVQIHGGMGFIEETGAAQYYRDARILPIYEGTNGIQANDLAFRKIVRDGGAAVRSWLGEIEETCRALDDGDEKDMARDLRAGVESLNQATQWILKEAEAKNSEIVASVYTPYLKAFGALSCGAMMGRSVLACQRKAMDEDFCRTKRRASMFYRTHILPQTHAWCAIVMKGAFSMQDMPPQSLAS